MQWILRTLAIVLAAVLMSGATYAIVQSNLIALPGGEGRGAELRQLPGTERGNLLSGGKGAGQFRGGFEGRGGEHRSDELGGLNEVGRNLLLMGVILAITLVVSRFLPKRTTAEEPAVTRP